MTSPARCSAAHKEDRRPCDGPPDAVRLVDDTGTEQTGCVRHAATVLASVDGVRVGPGPAGVEGAAMEAFKRAQHRRPFDFITDDQGGGHSRVPRSVAVVVAGTAVDIAAPEGMTYRSLVDAALSMAPAPVAGEEWELRDARGALVDPNSEIDQAHLEWYSRLFLNRRAGWGG